MKRIHMTTPSRKKRTRGMAVGPLAALAFSLGGIAAPLVGMAAAAPMTAGQAAIGMEWQNPPMGCWFEPSAPDAAVTSARCPTAAAEPMVVRVADGSKPGIAGGQNFTGPMGPSQVSGWAVDGAKPGIVSGSN